MVEYRDIHDYYLDQESNPSPIKLLCGCLKQLVSLIAYEQTNYKESSNYDLYLKLNWQDTAADISPKPQIKKYFESQLYKIWKLYSKFLLERMSVCISYSLPKTLAFV